MAIYHFSVKAISRSDGRSAVACSAYRSAENLIDKKYGKQQDYTKKNGVEFTNIYSPENTDKELLDRNNLWNKVEQVENRKNSLLAREFEIAFPCELNEKQRKEMLDDLCSRIVKKYNVVVDAAIHAPDLKSGTDERNYHAHIMFTARSIDKNTGQFSKTKYRDFSRDNGTQIVDDWRAEFAEITNDHLQKAGQKVRVNHLSYKDQRLDLEATKHEGSKATELRRQHKKDKEFELPDVCKKNDEIKKSNAQKTQSKIDLSLLENEIIASESIIIDLKKYKKKETEFELLRQEKQRTREKDREQFLELQEQYKNFADSYFSTENEEQFKLDILEEQFSKSKKWFSKQKGVYEREGVFYDDYTHRTTDLETPEFWLPGHKYIQKKEQIKKDYKNRLIDIIDNANIKKVVSDLRQTANRIIENNDEIPKSENENTEKPSFFKKLFMKKEKTYNHSYETLNDYDQHVSAKVEELEDTRKSIAYENYLIDKRIQERKEEKERELEEQRRKDKEKEELENSPEYRRELEEVEKRFAEINKNIDFRKVENDNDNDDSYGMR